jgi:exopolysaccharide production protein ExoQ
MGPNLALFLCVLYIFWLIARDRRRLANVSAATWIPTLWVIILGSRPISNWFGMEIHEVGAAAYLEDSPLDRFIFLTLIVSAFLTLQKRRVPWRNLRANNKCLVIYFAYFLISVLWSVSPFVAFKRWIKDLGNVLMVIVILSEADPIEAVKVVFRRCLYVLIPLSVVLIKYFPDLSHFYDPWEGHQSVNGIALSKNSLGSVVSACTLFLVWELLQRNKMRPRAPTKIEIINIFFLLGLAVWLLYKANSATSISCTVLGSAGLVAMSLPLVRKRLYRSAPFIVIGGCVLLVLSSVFGLKGAVFQLLGRDETLTGRTEIWTAVLSEKINPLIGAGYYSFFMGPRVEKFAEVYSFSITQAHNGYIQTYLDGGIIAVCALGAMVLSAGRNIKRKLDSEPYWASARIIFCLIVLVSNWTEATFSRLSISWFVLLLVMIEYPRPRSVRFAGANVSPSNRTALLPEDRLH